jgi:hypothetical protein
MDELNLFKEFPRVNAPPEFEALLVERLRQEKERRYRRLRNSFKFALGMIICLLLLVLTISLSYLDYVRRSKRLPGDAYLITKKELGQPKQAYSDKVIRITERANYSESEDTIYCLESIARKVEIGW